MNIFWQMFQILLEGSGVTLCAMKVHHSLNSNKGSSQTKEECWTSYKSFIVNPKYAKETILIVETVKKQKQRATHATASQSKATTIISKAEPAVWSGRLKSPFPLIV